MINKTSLLTALLPAILFSSISSADECNIILNQEAVVTEIVGLIQKRATFTGEAAAAMRALLLQDIRQKIQEFADAQGSMELLRERLGGSQDQSMMENTQRETEKKVLQPFTQVYSTNKKLKLSVMNDFVMSNFTSKGGPFKYSYAGPGVRWSSDDRYVLVREGSKDEVLVDTQTMKEFPNIQNALLSNSDHLIAQKMDDYSFQVTDLLTQQRWGPIQGNGQIFELNEDYIIYEINATERTTQLSFLSLIDGTTFSVGQKVVLSKDKKRFAYLNQKKKSTIVYDSATRSVIKEFPAYYSPSMQFSDDGYFLYERVEKKFWGLLSGVRKRTLVRLDDLSEFELPFGDQFARLSENGDFLFFDKTQLFFDLRNKTQHQIDGKLEHLFPLSGWTIMSEEIPAGSGKKQYSILNPWTKEKFPLDGSPYGTFSITENETERWSLGTQFLLDREQKQLYQFYNIREAAWVNDGEYLVFETRDSDKVYLTLPEHINEPDDWLEIGEHAFRVSHNGKMIATNRNGKLVLLKY